MRNHLSLPINEDTQVSDARRVAVNLVYELGFDDTDAGRVAIVATELARNLSEHGNGGELLMCTMDSPRRPGLEFIAIDKGPGMGDFEACMRDRYSTPGNAGAGLGAVQRATDFMDVYSAKGHGTAILGRVFQKSAAESMPKSFDVGAVSVPVRGETQCGDAWLVSGDGERVLAMIADGLGHGPDAAKAAEEAVRLLRESPQSDLCDIIDDMHAALRSTRGAAVSLAELRPGSSQVRYAGVGNIAGVIVDSHSPRSMVSHNGTVGHAVGWCQEFTYPWSRRALLVMHSDGISTQWDLNRYPGLKMRDPSLIAAVIYRDYKRSRDDATVVVAREHVA